jgi:hypothetical protein
MIKRNTKNETNESREQFNLDNTYEQGESPSEENSPNTKYSVTPNSGLYAFPFPLNSIPVTLQAGQSYQTTQHQPMQNFQFPQQNNNTQNQQGQLYTEINPTTLKEFNDTIYTTASLYKSAADEKEDRERNQEIGERVIGELARQQNIQYSMAAHAVAELYQKGAHLKNVQNRTVNINGLIITKQYINQAIIRIGAKITHRAMARAIRDTIYHSAKARDIPGHLFPLYKTHIITKGIILDPHILQEHSYYCTDFNIDNPNAPSEVIKFMTTRARNRSNKK